MSVAEASDLDLIRSFQGKYFVLEEECNHPTVSCALYTNDNRNYVYHTTLISIQNLRKHIKVNTLNKFISYGSYLIYAALLEKYGTYYIELGIKLVSGPYTLNMFSGRSEN